MANGIEFSDAVSVTSIVVVVILAILIYSWKKKDKKVEDHGELKTSVGKIESKQESMEEKIGDMRHAIEKLDTELGLGLNESKTELGDMKTTIERLASEGRSMSSKINEITIDLGKLVEKYDEMREKIRDVETEAKEARKHSHEHPFIGGKPV